MVGFQAMEFPVTGEIKRLAAIGIGTNSIRRLIWGAGTAQVLQHCDPPNFSRLF